MINLKEIIMKTKINQLKDRFEKNNIPGLTTEEKHKLLFGTDEELKEAVTQILKR